MSAIRIAVIVLLAAFAGVAHADNWAVIVAGSNTFSNYRHQTDACHAYQVVKKNGIPDERIVVMIYDDIAKDEENPLPGQLFNKPTAAGTPGVDVYAGCQKDYTGEDVTAANFLAVITGNSAAVKGKKVLKSNANDNVFIFFTDHGGTGIVAFPAGPYLYVNDLNTALRKMSAAKMYRKLVFYMEACESGSMFEGVLPKNLNIYVTTASNAEESSWGCYCPPEDQVNGVSIGSCLGDLYSVNWMEDADKQSSLGMKETLQEQYLLVQKLTDMSHVMQYGDTTFTNLTIGQFEGQVKSELLGRTYQGDREAAVKPRGVVNSRDIKLNDLYYAYLRAEKTNLLKAHKAAAALEAEVMHRVKSDKIFSTLAQRMTDNDNWTPIFTSPAATPIVASECVSRGYEAVYQYCGGFSDYSLQYTRVVYNVCQYHSHSNTCANTVVDTLRELCA